MGPYPALVFPDQLYGGRAPALDFKTISFHLFPVEIMFNILQGVTVIYRARNVSVTASKK